MIRPSKSLAALAALTAVATAILPVADAYAQAKCVTAPEKTAFDVRMMQTELMVATLTCRTVPGRDFSSEYNEFITKHRASVQKNGSVFQRHFKRNYGEAAQTRQDRYVTSLANDYSQVSMGSPTFCADHAPVFQRLASIGPKEFEEFARERAALRGSEFPLCKATKPKTQVAAAPKKSE
jgi:hypothetical protein